MYVVGLPSLSERVAHALGPQQWIKDSTLWILIYFDDGVYSSSSINGLVRELYTRGLCTRGCCTKGCGAKGGCTEGLYNMVTSIEQ